MRTIAEIDEDIRKLKNERDEVLKARHDADLTHFAGEFNDKWICEFDTTCMKNYELVRPIPDRRTFYHIVEVVDCNPNFRELTCRVDAKIRIARKDKGVFEFSVGVIGLDHKEIYLSAIERKFITTVTKIEVAAAVMGARTSFTEDYDVAMALFEEKK